MSNPQALIAEFQVRSSLCIVVREQSIYRLEFQDDEIFDKQIYAVRCIDGDAVILDRKRNLRLNLKPLLLSS